MKLSSSVEVRHRVMFIFPDHEPKKMSLVEGWLMMASITEIPEGAEALSFQSYVHVCVAVDDRRPQEIELEPFRVSGTILIKKERPVDADNFEFFDLHPNLEGKVWVCRRRHELKVAA